MLTGTTSRGPADEKVEGAAQAATDAETAQATDSTETSKPEAEASAEAAAPEAEAPKTISLPRDIGARSIFFTHCIPPDLGREFLQDNQLKLMGAYWGRFYRPQAYQSVYIGFNTHSPKPLQTKEKPRDLNGSRGRIAEDGGNAPPSPLTCINALLQIFGALMGPVYMPPAARFPSARNHTIFIANRSLRENIGS